ncbi:hypothetical protein LOK49_LG03G03795 [Camellia lanceoleosa]|uniref:Uncharacterized protein n=1 Tax=Camellia lanceoleosa TaxID=1840588 RepID=A0ACC0IDH8_9ERIC|nr:hypothetical protein LOK49_LG03G03795 [Camellia lanceoleosa]
MSSSNNGSGLQSIPAASRKMVQSLKEIINCSELEIYAMLKDCNMDPNETVSCHPGLEVPDYMVVGFEVIPYSCRRDCLLM